MSAREQPSHLGPLIKCQVMITAIILTLLWQVYGKTPKASYNCPQKALMRAEGEGAPFPYYLEGEGTG